MRDGIPDKLQQFLDTFRDHNVFKNGEWCISSAMIRSSSAAPNFSVHVLSGTFFPWTDFRQIITAFVVQTLTLFSCRYITIFASTTEDVNTYFRSH